MFIPLIYHLSLEKKNYLQLRSEFIHDLRIGGVSCFFCILLHADTEKTNFLPLGATSLPL